MKKKVIKRYWTNLSAKMSQITKEIQKWSPLVTLSKDLFVAFEIFSSP